MGRFPRTVTLEESFRRILRANYLDRPALADEIESFWWNDRKRLPDEDVAMNKARELLEERVARGKIRLRGVLDPRKPLEDIDPADAKVGKLDIFAGELRVFLHNKVVRTYRQVHCYETDLRREVKSITDRKPMSIAQTAAPAANNASTNEIPKFVSDYIRDNPTTASQDGIRKQWKLLHGARRRAELDAEWRDQAEPKGLLRKRGRRKQIAKS